MSNYNLAVIKPEDDNHYLVNAFLQSLNQSHCDVLLDSVGYIGSLGLDRHGFPPKDKRHFMIIDVPEYADLATTYFSSQQGASFGEIPDKLSIRILFAGRDGMLNAAPRELRGIDGSLQLMIDSYEGLLEKDPRELLEAALKKSQSMKQQMVHYGYFGLGKARLSPTYVAAGLQTPPDCACGRYLLSTTHFRGPYVAEWDRQNWQAFINSVNSGSEENLE